jgi:MoaA/NifB/PqqE/SkfB family radical SAM enzyme
MFAFHFADYLLRRKLKHIIVHVTNRCNMRCRHCFVDFSSKDEMSLNEFRSLAEQVGRLLWVDISGGEPFMRDELADIVSSFRADVITIPTNGYLTDRIPLVLEDIKERIGSELVISISIDGLKDTHDRLRQKSGSWDKAWETFEIVRGMKGVSVKINTVLSAANAEEILELMRLVRRKEPDFHSVILLRGSPADNDSALPSIETLESLAPEILRVLSTYKYGQGPISARILRSYHRYMWDVSLRTLRENRQVVPCLAGSAHMVVYANGGVSSCELLGPVGNIREYTIEELMNSSEFKDQRRAIQEGKCSCTHNCALLDSIILRPSSIPRLLIKGANTSHA